MARHVHLFGIDWLVSFVAYVRAVGPLPDAHFVAEHPASGTVVRSDTWADLQHLMWVEAEVIHASR